MNIRAMNIASMFTSFLTLSFKFFTHLQVAEMYKAQKRNVPNNEDQGDED